MAYGGGSPSFHNCTRLRIETVRYPHAETCWYRIYADDTEVAVIFGVERDALPLVAIDSPSRLVIGGDVP